MNVNYRRFCSARPIGARKRIVISWWTARSGSAKQGLLNNLVTENVGWELLCKIGRQLVQIIRGDHHLLKMVIENGLLQKYYMKLAPLVC